MQWNQDVFAFTSESCTVPLKIWLGLVPLFYVTERVAAPTSSDKSTPGRSFPFTLLNHRTYHTTATTGKHLIVSSLIENNNSSSDGKSPWSSRASTLALKSPVPAGLCPCKHQPTRKPTFLSWPLTARHSTSCCIVPMLGDVSSAI